MNVDKELQYEIWHEQNVTVALRKFLRDKWTVDLPVRLIAARRQKDADLITNLLAELDVVKQLEQQVNSGDFFTKAKPQTTE